MDVPSDFNRNHISPDAMLGVSDAISTFLESSVRGHASRKREMAQHGPFDVQEGTTAFSHCTLPCFRHVSTNAQVSTCRSWAGWETTTCVTLVFPHTGLSSQCLRRHSLTCVMVFSQATDVEHRRQAEMDQEHLTSSSDI